MADKTYWEGRQEKKYLAGEKQIQQYYMDLEKSFEQSKEEIQGIINNFYVRYADENGISFTAAQKSLSNTEIENLKVFINKVNASMGKYDQELNNMSIKARITRYQALLKQIDTILQQLYSIEYEYKGRELLKLVYSDSYYRTWFNIDVYNGFHSEYAQINPSAVEELIYYPFNGADFSSRIWKQKDHMLQMLSESVTTMIVQGKNPNTLSKDFAKKFGTKEYEAYRLLHTEGSFIIEQASQRAYQGDGVEKYQWLATLDLKTCELCRPLDGKIFEVGKGIVGETLAPRHMFCRCTTVPYYDDVSEEGDTRAARDPVTGKNNKVPANMTYEQWHKQYVASNPKAAVAEKKSKSYITDKKQHESYRSVLGAEVPESIDDFQELKYNNNEEYGILKAQFKGMTYYNSAVANEPEITNTVKNIAKATNVDVLGLEYRLKTKESYIRKIRSNYKPGDNEYEINDILRYTYESTVDKLADKTIECIKEYLDLGYNTIKIKNSWMDTANPYKGINTIIQAPNGQKFELQYHTQESFDLKNGELHKLYEKQRLISDKDSKEYLDLGNKMFELSDKLTVPSNIEGVK